MEVDKKTGEVTSTLADKLIAIQATIKVPKGQYNKFGDYHYRSCEDILAALKPVLFENGLALTIQDDVVAVGGRVYVKATATLTDGKETISTTAFAREPNEKKKFDESQITGMASSYARKYALNGLLALDDTKDADTMNNAQNASQAQSAYKQDPKAACLSQIMAAAKKGNVPAATVTKIIEQRTGKQNSKELTLEETQDIAEHFGRYVEMVKKDGNN